MVDEIGESAGAGDDSSNDSSSKMSAETPESSEGSIRLRKYELECRQLSSGLGELKRRALIGGLRTSRLRSLAWAILLGVLPPESDKWLEQIRKNREAYSGIRKRLSCDPRSSEEPEDNPLSQNDESVWNQHFQDAELQTLIKLDVVRSFPGVEFFKQPEIQEAMVNVLFCFARETPILLYRQGMHEILAPLLFVLQSDHKAAEHSSLGDILIELMDPKYLEHDSYALFKTIMTGIEKFYRLNDIPTDASTYLPVGVSKVPNVPPRRIENEVVRHLALIRDRLLIPEDPELADHLHKCDIALSLFGIRWLRVLFGREFPLHDLLVLWDALFAEGRDFTLAGYIMVAMLVAIRNLLLNNDTMVCLTHLMHYPSTIDVQYIIDHALYLKYPDQYIKPVIRSISTPIEFNPHQSNATIHRKYQKTKSRTTSTSSNEKLKEIIPNIKVAGSADDNAVIDGYTLQEPEVLLDELTHAHSVMALCKIKLEHYEKTLRESLPSNLNSSHPAYQALGGIRELSSLLQSRYNSPPDVEPAFEANELGHVHKSHKVSQKNAEAVVLKTERSKSVVNNDTNIKKKSKKSESKYPVLPPNKEFPLKVINIVNSNTAVQGAPSPDPLRLRID